MDGVARKRRKILYYLLLGEKKGKRFKEEKEGGEKSYRQPSSAS